MGLAALAFVAGARAGPVQVQPPGLHPVHVESPRFDPDPHLPPSRCLVRVEIDEGGLPVETQARACPPKFAALAEDAVARWRWSPPRVDGEAVRARTVVAVEFTGRGRIPVRPAERCTYALRITVDGRVSRAGQPAPQCAIWPIPTLPGSVPAAGTCAVAIDSGILRDTPGWVVPEACPEAALEVAAIVAAGSLFVEGTASTRLVIELPAPGTVPTASIEVRGPEIAGPTAGGRIGGTTATSREQDPTLAVPEATRAPTVDLQGLLNARKGGAPTPPPEPAPEEDEEDEQDEEDEEDPDDG